MLESFASRPKTKWAAIIAGGFIVAFALFVSLFNWNLLRPALAREITAKTGRPAAIDGDLKVHIWSWHPSAEVNGLAIKNPTWARRELMFGVKRLTVSVSLAHLLRGQIVLPEVNLLEPTINLERDSRGRASWELGTQSGTPNHDTQPTKLPAVRRLIIEDGKLHVIDQIRKLTFSGTLIAADKAGQKNDSALKVRCSGTLNAKPFRLEANGGPLLDLDPSTPYSFSARLAASDINLDTEVTVPKPFDLSDLTVKFVVTGEDLADVYYLTGLALPNTPKYRLAATIQVAGTQFDVEDLKGRLGSSDLEGKVRVQSSGARPKLTAKLSSATLNIVDLAPTLGQRTAQSNSLATGSAQNKTAPSDRAPRAAKAPHVAVQNEVAAQKGPSSRLDAQSGGGSDAASNGWLLPDADLQVNRVRGMDADVTYRAASVTAPKVPMKEVNLHVVLDNGLLTIDPLSFVLDQGKFSGRVQIDARRDVPVSDIDMRIDAIDLGQFKSATMKQAPLDGTMYGRFQFHGSGSSVHKLAAASDGAMSVVIPHGQISDVLAELTGINVLRGLGLLLAKGQNDTEIRCGIMDFKDRQGKLNTTTVFVDTSNVLITGRGSINLGNEDLNIALQGDPKKVRLLRLRSPITLHGTLLHPAVGIKADKLAEQAGVAAALGVLLTPAAAAIAFVDPGLAKDKDCSTVLSQADAGVQDRTAQNQPPAPYR